MKIALVSPFPPSMGTLNEYAFHMVKHMEHKENIEEIIVLTDSLPEGEFYGHLGHGPKIVFESCWTFNSYKTAWNIHKQIKKHKPDVVFYNIQFLSFGDQKIPATLGLLSPWMTKLSGTPSVALLHNIIETVDYESAGITKNPLLKWAFNAIGTVITRLVLSASMVTVTMAKYVGILEKKYGVKNVALVPHGSFELPPMPSFDESNKPKKIMTFGKFGTYKKVEGIIEAVDTVRQRTGEQIEIVIAGTDNPNVKGYLDHVKEKYSHIKDIRFTGYVAEEDVPVLFGESTAVVFDYTSTTGSSGVLHQAGSYGKAVALPVLGDLKELIEEEGYRGLYFAPGNVTEMANAIETLVMDEAKRTEIAKQNYAAAASLPMSDIVDWYLLHFDQLIPQKESISQIDALESATELAVN